MAGTRRVEFDLEALLHLMIHYSEGEIPLDSTPVGFDVSQFLPRWISLKVDSDDWTGTPYEQGDGYNGVQPFVFRYEGKRVLTLQHLKDNISWGEPGEIEAPKLQ